MAPLPKTRRSSFVNRRQASTFSQGITFADTLNRSMNWFVTINFSHSVCPADQVGAAFEKLRDNHFTRWLRYRSQKPFRRDHGEATYVWVIENASGQTHVHWMVYVPRSLIREFKSKVEAWTIKVLGSSALGPGAIHIEPVERPLGLGKYLLKGIDPRVAKLHRVDPQPQGIVHGKRCGVSKCLGKAARERYWTTFRDEAQKSEQSALRTGTMMQVPF